MKRVSKILFPVAEDTNLAPNTITPTLLNNAVDGAYLLVDKATGVKATAASKEIELVVKCGEGLVTSGPIKKGFVKTGYSRTQFDASEPRIQTTTDFPVPVVGTEYVLYVTNQEQDNYFLPRQRFAIVATPAMTSEADLVDAFVALIEDVPTEGINVELGVSAARVANTLELTGVEVNSASPMLSSNKKFEYEVLFELALADNLEDVDVLRTQEPDPGCGEGSEMRKLEEVHKGYLGHLNNVTFSQVAYGTGYVYKSDFAVDYDVVVVEYESPFHTQTEGNVNFEESIVIAAPTATILDGFPIASGALAVDLETTLEIDTNW
jgi:hypothetical protein